MDVWRSRWRDSSCSADSAMIGHASSIWPTFSTPNEVTNELKVTNEFKVTNESNSIDADAIVSALDAYRAGVQQELEGLYVAILAAVHGQRQSETVEETRPSVDGPVSRPDSYVSVGSSLSSVLASSLWPAIITRRVFDKEDDGIVSTDALRASYVARSFSRRSSLFETIHVVASTWSFRKYWDMFGSIIVLYELIFTPLLVVRQIELSHTLLALWWIACAFWIVEVIINFSKRHSKNNKAITNFLDTSRYYLKTWFTFDLCLVIIDIVSLSMHLRFLRLTRLLKVWRIRGPLLQVQNMSAWIMSKRARLAIRMCYFVLGFVLLSHLLGCAFCHLGEGLRPADGWVDVNTFAGQQRMQEANSAMIYVISLQWAFAHLCLGTTDVVEVTTLERSFSVFVFLLGLVINCTIIAFFSAIIVQHMYADMQKDSMLEELRIFMHEHSTHSDLATKVMNHAIYVMGKRKTYLENEVSALEVISSTLRKELLYEIRLPFVLSHDLFKLWDRMDSSCLETLCEGAITFEFFSNEEEVFNMGDEGKKAFVLAQGQADYVQHPKPSNRSFLEQFPKAALPSKLMSRSVPLRLWISEASLWSHWIHVGQLFVERRAKFLAVSAKAIPKIIRAHPIIGKLSAVYSRNFHIRLITSIPPVDIYPDDLKVPHTDLHELLSSQFSVQTFFEAVHAGKLNLRDDQLANLQRELQDEKCSFRFNIARNCYERYVALSGMRLFLAQQDDDSFFVEVGRYDCSRRSLKAKCVLPAIKRPAGELPIDALNRLLDKYFAPFKRVIKLLDLEHTVEVTVSQEYGIETTYDKSVHIASLSVPLDELMLIAAVPKRNALVLDDFLTGLPPVFVLPADGNMRLLGAWISLTQFEVLKDSKKHLKNWLEGLDIDVAVELADCPLF